VNGLLLVIPAESLIKDTADTIEKKASRIAKQLDTVQRTLGVRFPVFVVITKADLVNGFREFFDSVQDPALQHQMLGWSNPAGLDDAFDPEAVDEHLRVVERRLSRRRLGLMLDPVNTDNPKARRTDQVDALYAFPDALTRIAPRLKQYLSMIFVQGEWSVKPLFLRGIYFTSSMREGSALDADLANALGIPVDQLPEGRVWERDRAFFLRDLFMGKVFRERGLVTTGANTTRLRRARAAIIALVGFVGLSALGGLTWLGSSSLRNSVERPSTFWNAVSRAYTKGAVPVDPVIGSGGPDKHLLPIVQKLLPADVFYQYRGDAGEDSGDLVKISQAKSENQRRAAFTTELRSAAEARIGVPTIFKPVAAATGDATGNLLERERLRAAKSLIRASVLVPLLDATRSRLLVDSDEFQPSWSGQATAALQQLQAVNSLKNSVSDGSTAPGSAPSIAKAGVDALLRYALLGTDQYERDGVAADVPLIAEAINWSLEGEDPAVIASSLGRSRDVQIIRDAKRTMADVGASASTAAQTSQPAQPATPNPSASTAKPTAATLGAGERLTVSSIAAKVAEAAAGDAAGKRPAMPLGAKRDEFDARYAPEAMARIAGPMIAAKADASETTPAREADIAAIDGYLENYAEYWTRTVWLEARPDPATRWPALQGAIAANAQVWKHHGPLEQLCKRVGAAAGLPAEKLGATNIPTHVRAALERAKRAADDAQATLANASFERAMEAMIAKWRGLGADAGGAMSTLTSGLGADASGATDYFAVAFGPGDQPDFAQAYWRWVSIDLARALRRESVASGGADGVQTVRAALEQLRFPLGSMEATATLEGLVAPMPGAGLGAFGASVQAAAALAGTPGPATGPTGDAAINSEIQALLAKPPRAATSAEADQLARAAKWLKLTPGLPTAGSPAKVKVSMLWNKPPATGEASVKDAVSGVRLISGETDIRASAGDQPSPLAEINWPSATLTLEWTLKGGQRIVQRWGSGWGVPALLAQNPSETDAANPRIRDVKLRVPTLPGQAGAEASSLWLRLEFDRDLPAKDELPR
jgi:hypothetical protein